MFPINFTRIVWLFEFFIYAEHIASNKQISKSNIELWNEDSHPFHIRKVLWMSCMSVNSLCLAKDSITLETVYSVFLIKSSNTAYIHSYNMMLKLDLVVISKQIS